MFEEVWQLLLVLGVPSIISGLGMSRVYKHISRSDEKREKEEACREQYNFLILRSINATLTLGQVTAKALKDGHCNGDVTVALEEASAVKREQERFFNEQVSKNFTR